ncbi:hypothetical protein EVG20_g8240 [Dentipellis fragilis]|uniref:RanBP2-type domain-containing protein n=1 Tax=Dentipellis fragilis TaxID=205917 RepID=A0A4Y9Y9R2_9AGAM|nr:hypothetical protein EVG20_g8240 [Dentipellis fragilis]
MSAIRRNDRRAVRSQISSPYKRPGKTTTTKKSGWSITNIFSFLNPFTNKSPEDEVDEETGDSREDVEEEPSLSPPSSAAETLSRRGHQLSQQQTEPADLPPPEASSSQPLGSRERPFTLTSSASTPPPPPRTLELQPSPSAVENLETVKKYLQERGDGQPLHQVELRGLMSLLTESVQENERPEPFRFTSSPSPARGNSPIFNIGGTGPTSPDTQTPRKTLSKNPNGVYKWQGAGSARPRNRFQSPAFGPPRASPSRITLSPPEVPKTDSKRRRVGANAETSTPQRADAASPSPARQTRAPAASGSSLFSPSNGSKSSTGAATNGQVTNGTGAAEQQAPSTPRLRMSIPPKPTAPAVPSPLRQAWGQSDSPPQPQPSPSRQPTRAASMMSELLKDVTPPKKPDVANPYQTASPVKPVMSKRPQKKRKAPEEKKVEKKAEEKEASIEAGLSPQRIIEATVPKGSKRSRPPADMQKSVSVSPSKSNGILHGTKSVEPSRRSSRLQSPEPPRANGTNGRGKASTAPSVDENSDEDNRPSPKKQKKADSRASPVVEEVDDVEMSSSALFSPLVTRPTEVIEPSDSGSIFGAKSTPAAPSAGSSNAFGTSGTSVSPSKSAFGVKSSIPKEPSKLRFGFAAESEEKSTRMESSPTEPPPAPVPKHASLPKTAPSVSPFSMSATPAPKPTVPASAQAVASTSKDPKVVAASLDVSALPVFSFTITGPAALFSTAKPRNAAKRALPSSLPSFEFTFGAKSSGVSTPSISKATSSGFNWGAAGVKPPAKSSETWTCSTCMLQSPESATKCVACEEPRPGAAPKPAASGFNWEAAGMKPPREAASGTWTCSVCSLQSPESASKCVACENPRP